MADPTSTSATQMQLATSPVFIARLQYFLLQTAGIVLAEAHATPFHSQRAIYAQAVVNGPASAAANAGALIASSNVGGAVIVGTVVQWSAGSAYPNQFDTSAGDTAVQTAVVNAWNTLARVDSGT